DTVAEAGNGVVELNHFTLAGRHYDRADVALSQFHRNSFHQMAGVMFPRLHPVRRGRTWSGQKAGKTLGRCVERFPRVPCSAKCETFVAFSRGCKHYAASCGLMMWCYFFSLH